RGGRGGGGGWGGFWVCCEVGGGGLGRGAAGRWGAPPPPHPRRQRAREAVVGGEIPLDLGHAAERALVDQTLQGAAGRLLAALVADGQHDTGPAARLGGAARIGDRERERFVDEDVLARGGGGHDVLGMRRVGRRDQHALDLAIREHGVEGRQIAAPVGLRERRAVLGGAAGARDDAEARAATGRIGQRA